MKAQIIKEYDVDFDSESIRADLEALGHSFAGLVEAATQYADGGDEQGTLYLVKGSKIGEPDTPGYWWDDFPGGELLETVIAVGYKVVVLVARVEVTE